MGLEKKVYLAGNLNYDTITTNSITPEASTDLSINGVTGKDIKIILTDASGARKLKIIDSGAAEVASIDSNGLITANGGLVGALTGDVTGNVTGAIVNAETAHNYAAGHADWTLSAAEKLSATLICTNADAGANIIAPAEARRYIVRNASGHAITIKKSGGTGVTVANGKTAEVIYSATAGDYIRVTADVTH